MFGIDTKRLKQLSQMATQTDAVEEEEITFSDIVENYKLFMKLVTLIETIANAKELGLKNLKNVVEVLTEDMDDEEYEDFVDLVIKLLFYLKVSQSAIDDLLDEDEEISAMELENLIELVIERMGENDLYEFVAYAIHNPDLPDDVNTDSIQMDWSFYEEKDECTKNKPNVKNGKCFKGFHGKGSNFVKGYWLYPEDFGNDDSHSASNHTPHKSIAKKSGYKWGKVVKKTFSKEIRAIKKLRGNKNKQNNSKSAGGRHASHKTAGNAHKAG